MTARRRPAQPRREEPGIDLLELKATSCRWPFGEAPVRYCGADTGGVLATYCASHRRLAYVRHPTRADRKIAGTLVPAAGERARA